MKVKIKQAKKPKNFEFMLAQSLVMFNKTMETFEFLHRHHVTKWAQRTLCSNSASFPGWMLL